MAKKTSKSQFATKVGGAGGREAHEAHKSDETTYGAGADLPGGIEGGIAQLTECKFDVYKTGDNKGEYYWLAAGIVKRPKDADGIPVEGLRTQIMEPMCDTPNRSRESVADHYAWVLNELRKLGVDTEEIGFDDVEGVAAALKEEGPHFRFRTWKGAKQTSGPFAGVEPRVNHDWRGACEYMEDEEADSGVTDETPEEQPEAEDPNEGDDLAALAKAADRDEGEGDAAAARRLAELAEAAGVNHEEVPTWAEVAQAIEEGGEQGEPEPEEETVPEKGEIAFYKPPRARKAVECEVTAVFPRKKVANLKNLDDGKLYKAVPWSKLQDEE